MSEFSSIWFSKAKTLEIGQEIFLRVANKAEQTQLANELEKDIDEFGIADPVLASQLFVNKRIRDLKLYVTIERKFRTPFTGFLRDKNGNFEKITIDPERYRIIKLMLKDKIQRSEIEETLNGLTDDEISEFFPTKL